MAGPLPLVFEASIAAQMILFASVQAAGVGRGGTLRPVLALATGSLGLAAAINLLAALGALGGLRDLNLLLEIGCVAASFVYVTRAYEGAPAPSVRDLWHAALPVGVFLSWMSGLVGNVDQLTLLVLSAYLAACAVALARHWPRYRPQPVLVFALLLTASVAALVVLRMGMMSDVALGLSLRESGAYLALLLVMAGLSSAVLVLELRHPNMLAGVFVPAKAASALSAAALDEIDVRFQRLMREGRPHLDPELSLEALAGQLNLKPRELSQFASGRYGVTVPALVNQWRLDEAARMLADPANKLPVTTIMYDAGFGSKSSFQREFHKRFGMSPSAYRGVKNGAGK